MDPQDTPDAHYNRGNALYAQRRLAEALASYDRAVAQRPGFALAWNNRGGVLRDLGRADDAIASISRAIAIHSGYAQAWFNRATVRGLDRGDYPAAIADVKQALALDPGMIYAPGLLLHLQMQACDWRDFDRHVAAVEARMRAGTEAAEPFVYQAVSCVPADLFRCAEIHAASRYPAAGRLWRPRAHDRIRLGYVSGEFRTQATALLAARLYALHDRARFEVFAFDSGAADDSPMRAQLEAAFDRWIGIREMTDAAAAARIAAEEIDILVNLNGYFGEERMGVFARRPAPLQVNYLGFPGTLGAPYIDYIVADAIVIPPGEAAHYAEQVAWLPDSYQVNNDRRAVAAEAFSRADCGLPGSGFVFCNFNNAYKFTPGCFAAWMRILRAAPGSVLWLLEANRHAAANLRQAAKAQGVAAERLVFAPYLSPERHLARLKLADLCLDSFPYNAHTTASDSLWAGVPLLTLRGSAFAGRVAESLLRAAGLPELVAPSLGDFEAQAIALAGAPQTLKALREKLAANRVAAPLFDTPRFTRRLEAAYIRMWELHSAGETPRSFEIACRGGAPFN